HCLARSKCLKILQLLLRHSASGGTLTHRTTAPPPQAFLGRYGYLRERVGEAPSPESFDDAVREFQWTARLPVSGVLDAATLRQMKRPRCGVDDADSREAWAERVTAPLAGRRARLRKPDGKWYKRQLSYRLVNWPRHLPEGRVREAVRAAFRLWANVSALDFWEAPAGPADIRLTFFQGDHNDGLANAFDGPGGALAHAFLPRRGEAHFDSEEPWSLYSRRGRGLFVVLAHEVGHTLGLGHSPARGALMAPYYKKLGRAAVLSRDDVLAIQNLYGKPLQGSAVQLPGSLFTDFEAWNPDGPGGRERSGVRGPHYCHSFFDAITVDREQRVYVFKGGHFWEVGADGNATGPWPLQTRWPGSPPRVEAAAVSEVDGKFYFFKGSRCWCFRGSRLEPGFPQRCHGGGLPRHPDAALFFRPLGRLVIFKDRRYYALAEGALRPEPHYPRSLRDWKGVPPGVRGALPRPDGSVYFFRDDRYWRFDQARLRVVGAGRWADELAWTGCGEANSGGALF
uniref:Matrix metallopeptidase 28 n=1 Tax=Ornithorhynchus anatinus TaxID=9258 RepID=A0A6I8NPS8_ORNAN